jgi:transcriptional regulator with PAS, ATPase and Fis domain
VEPDQKVTLIVDGDPERRARIAQLLQQAGIDGAAVSDLGTALVEAMRAELHHTATPGGPRPTLWQMERNYARRILSEMGGNKTRAAEVLGIDRKTLYRLIGDPPATAQQAPQAQEA